jgi:hypothetical protein
MQNFLNKMSVCICVREWNACRANDQAHNF